MELLQPLMRHLRNDQGDVEFGSCRFDRANFEGDVSFRSARFVGDVFFDHAHFTSSGHFGHTIFQGSGSFKYARFAGHAGFPSAHFHDAAYFEGVIVDGEGQFRRATFSNGAHFNASEFQGVADFSETQFGKVSSHITNFGGATFHRPALFTRTQFAGPALWGDAKFANDAWFEGAQFFSGQFIAVKFEGATSFSGARFSGKAEFDRASVAGVARLGAFVAGDTVTFNRATFEVNPSLEIAAPTVVLNDAKFEAGGSVRVRYADITLEGATFSKPTTVAFTDQPFNVKTESDWEKLDESTVAERIPRQYPRLLSVRKMDAANLSIWGTDLSECLFVGAHRLDELRLESVPRFHSAPSGVLHDRLAWPPFWRWSYRQTLIEEHHWRVNQRKRLRWRSPDQHPLASSTDVPPIDTKISSDFLVSTYRALRRAQENNKNEPGAADFYYGEMEMRRHGTHTPRGERWVLRLYWLFSGYGLRAARALGGLLVLLVLTTAVLVTCGIPNEQPAQHATGSISAARKPGQDQALTLTLPSQHPDLAGPIDKRWTGSRLEQAARIALDALVLRSTDQQLTEVGKYTEMFSRILGPVLLALVLLAIRNRVKR